MNTYLSIDLDFWNRSRNYDHMRFFLNKVKSITPNIKMVDSHEDLRNHVNSCNCNHLINVDYHSDIYDKDIPVYDGGRSDFLNCGTWVCYVNCRKNGNYTWIHPHIGNVGIREGYCHSSDAGHVNPFFFPQSAGWYKTSKIATKHPEDHINWSSIIGIGIAFSYEWIRHGTSDNIVKIAKEILGKRPPYNKRALIY